MPDEELLDVREIELTIAVEKLLSKDGYRVNCEICGQEVINKREIVQVGVVMCRPCAGEQYYQPVEEPVAVSVEFTGTVGVSARQPV